MSRETLESVGEHLGALSDEGTPSGSAEALAARLAELELAYDDLLQRLRTYERERVEVRERLARILSWISGRDTNGGR